MTVAYRIEVERQAQKALARLPRQAQTRIATAIDALVDDPHPAGCRPVKEAEKGTYRVRVGDYRVIYVVLDDERVVIVVRVGRRNERTYERL